MFPVERLEKNANLEYAPKICYRRIYQNRFFCIPKDTRER
jgi:hypothetical protein